MIGITEACQLVLKKSGQKYISAISEYDNKYDIGIAFENGDVQEGFSYSINKDTGEVGYIGSAEMFVEHENEIPYRVPDEFRCPNFKYYQDYPK